MLADSIKFKGYGCFKADWAGFDEIKPINLIIGKNNTGKSQLIDLIEPLTISRAFPHCSIQCTGVLTEDTLKIMFPESQMSADLRTKFDDWRDHGMHLINAKLTWELSRNGENSVVTSEIPIQKLREPELQRPVKQRIESHLSKIPTSLLGRTFRRLAADRDIIPEPATRANDISPNGSGASNLIRRFLVLGTSDQDVIRHNLLEALRNIFGADGNFTDITIRQTPSHPDEPESELWEVSLREESKGLVTLGRSGSGIKTILLVLLNLILMPKIHGQPESNYVFAFEELENNLHPSLLRRLLLFINEYVANHKCTIFLTSHSCVTLDYFSLNPDAQIVHVVHDGISSTTKTIHAHFDRVGAIESLGAKPSDILQSNGIVWVEGPSDRIYINRFVDIYSDGRLREGRDYHCAFYGGSLLANCTVANPDEFDDGLCNLIRINPNVAIVCDGDRTYGDCKLKPRVERIKQEIESAKRGFLWITEAKEMENYIPGTIWAKVFELDTVPDPALFDKFSSSKTPDESSFWEVHKLSKSFDKMAFAAKATNLLKKSHVQDRFDLDTQMRKLVEIIDKWNS